MSTQYKMKVTVCFGEVKVVVPCQDGDILVEELARKASERFRRATNQVRFYEHIKQN